VTTPEEAIEDGIYNRLTHATYGIIVDAGKYCADNGGVQKWHGEVDLTPESLRKWAFAGAVEGPLVLIVAGNAVEYDTDYREAAIGTYTIQIYICAGSWRSQQEAASGDAGSDSRGPGVWQVRSDILDRILNFGIVSSVVDLVTVWEDPAWVVGGRLLATQNPLVLYELTLACRVSRLHNLVAWGSLDDLDGVDVQATKEPSPTGTADDFIVSTKTDVP
jgi:hypothetical protein